MRRIVTFSHILCLISTVRPERWKVSIKTGTDFGAGTDATVRITVYGIHGSSPRTELNNPGNDFQNGDYDHYYVNGNIGKPYKVKIENDGRHVASKWQLNYIILSYGGRSYTFHCNCWIDDSHRDLKPQECKSSITNCRSVDRCFLCSRCEDGFSGTGKEVCRDIDECASNPCQNGGTCHNLRNRYSCSCWSGVTGVNCQHCPPIAFCQTLQCARGENICGKCNDQGVDKLHSLYWPVDKNKRCEATCSWKDNWCWPGRCTNNLESTCICQEDFQPSSSNPAKCDLKKTASLVTCTIGSESSGGDVTNSSSSGKDCFTEQDAFMKFQPKYLSMKFITQISVHVKNPKPAHIFESSFGIVDSKATIVKISKSGNDEHQIITIEKSQWCNKHISDDRPWPATPVSCTANVPLSQVLRNGEQICVIFDAFSGGFMKTIDFGNTISDPHIFKQTKASNRVCLRFDNAAPEHCSYSKICADEPIQILHRVTTEGIFDVLFSGWRDPIPSHGKPEQASGISYYEISLHDIKVVDDNTLRMNEGPLPGSTQKVKATTNVHSLKLHLPKEPALYGVSLDVVDNVGNSRRARRFVLYDNSSSVEINGQHRLFVKSGNVKTNYTWQVHLGDICLSWRDRYYNSYHKGNNLLRKILPDHNNFYMGVYEQYTGVIPVNGTVNVDGIVKYKYNWRLNSGNYSWEIPIPNVLDQGFCRNLNPRDGDTFTFQITPTDINGRELTELITVYIDSSIPEINNLGLNKDGHNLLYVHNSTDLSLMKVEFHAEDIHSGLFNIAWLLGTHPNGRDVGSGSLAVQEMPGSKVCPSNTDCYCPNVGVCERSLYSVSFNGLVEKGTNDGKHNREYYFTLIVTNNARLVNIHRVDILLDDSPPVAGVVMEGPPSEKDIDYTSSNDVEVHWKGFIDHESGIRLYVVGISDHCQSLDEIRKNSTSLISKTLRSDHLSTIFKLPQEGKYFFSVFAYNNAMEPSNIVCTDGVVLDKTPPLLSEFVLHGASAKDIVACFNMNPRLILENITSVNIHKSDMCLKFCRSSKAMIFLPNLPNVPAPYNDTDFANHICSHQRQYSSDWFIYLPSDQIQLSWNVSDDESQIEDVLVGFSSDISETTSPDIKDFVSAQTLKSYINHHEGLDRGVPFYVVIKAVNKANLETVVTYGPVIIDLTPPQYAGGLHTTSNDDDFYVTWNNNTFQEMEQKESIDTILFRFAYENGQYVTPHYQAAILYNCPLNKSVSCFKFPLRRIQVQDAENTMNFYCELYVYNTAGLYLTVKTQTFQVPSRFPPGDGVVSDVDPDYTSENADIDFQFNNSRACVTWKGFRHHKSIHFYVGLRSLERLDNVVELTRVNSTTYHCFENLNLIHSTRYYFTVKAVCSGGTRTSFSDGFTVIDHDQTLSSVTVSDGKKCNDTHLIRKLPITLKQNAPLRFEVKFNLSVDLTYTLTLSCCSDSNIIITSDDILVEKLRGVQANSQIWAMRSLSLRRPFIVIENKNTSSSECTCIMSLLPCPVKASYQSNSRQYTGHVDVDGELIKPFISHYEVALFSSSIGQHEELNMIVPYRTIFQNNFTITDVHLQESRVYQSSVRVCFDNICLPPVLSKGIVLQASPSSPGKIEGSLGVYGPNCTKLSALVQPFRCSAEVDAQFHLWSLSTEPDGSSLIMGWLPLHSKEFEDMKIEYCQKLPVYPHRPMYLCVKGICHSGVSSTKCTELGHESNGNEYSKYVLYEFDAWMKETPRIKSSIYSLNLGSILSLLHTKELDFCTSDIVLAGAIPYASDREIDWFLMEIDRIPGQPCQDDMLCKTHLHTNEGFVKFPRTVLKPNTKYFICASSNATVVQREKFSEYLEEFSLCGNGFIIDNDPPRLGRVDILQDVPGFITSSSELLVKWSDFSDIEQHLDTGLISGIKNYLYAIGTHSHGEDVVPFTFANTETSMTVRNLTLRAGAIYYATVKAVDYAGHETTAVSDGVICDTTPPVKGHISVGNALLNISFISVNNFEVHLDGFEDNESGIAEFKIGIGSSPNTTDTIPLFPVDGLSALISKNKNMIDGHHYFVIAKITNNAGLSTSMSSAAFIFDSSPPTGGIVKDGPRNKTFELDYQEDTLFLYAHWDGFKDQHSNILHYAVGVGTTPYTSDIEEMVEVGLTTEHFWHSLFIPGTKYYVTVKACNGAGLCTSVSSDGIIMDNSAPVSGLIHVGLSDRHQHFYGHRSVFSMQWVGFQDPHSDISHFEWCLGSEPGLCDLHQVENCLLSQSIVKSGLLLPLNSNIYAMVRAVNNVGLSTESFSDKFQIDITPPSVIKTPKFELNGMDVSSKENTQWDNSLLRLSWKFEDLESPILKHILLLRSHKNGKVVTQTTTCGSEEKVTILFKEGKLLDDGSTYTAWVTACNAAGLCTTSNSSDILIDSTPPHLGGFTKDMTWKLSNHNGVNTTEVNLSWHGFEDAESGLNKYLLSVSRTFSGTDLSSGIVSKSPSGMLDGRESMKMYLSEKVESSTLLVLSIWAENGVGLRSRISRVTVTLVSRNADQTEGILEIQRHSCTSHYCNGDCTCAVVGRKCDLVSDISKCHDLNNNSSVALPSITVNIGNIEGKHQHLTASASCITGHWLVSKNKTEILRYEWSIGVHGQKPGDGVFDIQTENTWYDVGMDTNVTFCFNNGKTFIHRTSYVLYVKAWYSESTFSIYSSEPVLVDRTDAAAIQGSSVMESIDQCQSDVEYTNYMNITICWRDVFSEQQGSILHYELMGGTSPYGSDFLPMTNLGHMTQYKINPGDLHPGTRYYFTVMSTNSVGLVSSLVSDGVVIDLDEPVEGVVYNTISFRNVHFQSSADTLGVSWEGFVDHQSYIKSYNIQLLDTVSNANVSIPTSVGSMKNSILLKQLPLENKGSYRLMINAHDAAGHISKIVYSPKITIDTTPPVGYSCQKYERLDVITKPVNASENQTHNGLIKIYHGSVSMNSRSWVLIKLYLEFTPQSKSIILKLNGKMKSLYLATNANQSSSSEYLFLAEGNRTVDISLWNYEGHNILYPLVSIERCSKPIPASSKIIKVQQIGPLTLSVSYFIDDAESGIKNFFVGVGTTKGGFQLNNLSAVGRLYHTVIAVDAMHGSPVYITVIAKNNADQNSIFKAGPIILDHTKPYINQLESTLFIRENVKQDIGIRYNNDSLRTNDTELYNDTYVPAHEEINQTLNSVQFSEVKNASLSRENVFVDLVVHWNSVDPESGIEFCECSLGTRPGISNLYRWIPAKHNDSCHFHGLQFEHGTTVYPAVRCTNTVQLKHTEYGRGVMISYEKPDIQMANIDVIRSERSISPELQSGGVSVQSDKTSIQYQWHGFQDDSRISFYTTRIMNKGQEIQTCGTSGITYCRLNNRYQEDTPYSIEIKAINLGNITSDAVNATVIISHSSPSLTGSRVVISKTGNMITVSWSNVFQPNPYGLLTYQVFLGSQKGLTDLLQPVSTTKKSIDVNVDNDVMEVFVAIYATSPTGTIGVYRDNLTL